jgi:hypothetical protein
MKTKHIPVVLFLISMWSCGSLNKNDLREYVENKENGLVQDISYPDVSYHILFRPNDLAYIYEKQNGKPEKSELEAFKKDRENTSLFILDVSLSQSIKGKVNDYTEIRETYQNALNANLANLTDGEETIPCLIYHCETMGKGTYRINLLFGRGTADIKSNWTIRFYDPVTGNNPEFNFEKEDLQKIPSLKI